MSARRNIRVLMIEDDVEQARMMIYFLLQSDLADFHVTNLGTLKQAVEFPGKAEIDVVTVDLSLPDSKGVETFMRVKELFKDKPMLVVSVLDDTAVGLEAVRLGAQDYLHKDGLQAAELARSAIYALERKQIELELKRSEERFKQLFESSPLGIGVVNAETQCIVQANQVFCDIIGYEPDEAVGLSVEEITHPDDYERERELVRSASLRRTGFSASIEKRYIRKDGEISWVSLTTRVLPLVPGESMQVLGMVEDITGRKQIEQRILTVTEELKRSNAELEQFAYVASHDLLEPLRMVQQYVKLLERRYADKLDDDAREFIGFAADGAERMQAMIQALLQYSRINTRGKLFEEFDSGGVLDEVLRNLEVAIRETGAVITRDDMPVVCGDRSQLARLFQNLIANSIKYKDEGPPRVHVTAAKESNEFRFAVSDNGVGIQAKDAERAFQIFQRLHGRREIPGDGIGLAIAKRIVERHGGRIWIESADSTGTTVYFTLPCGPVSARNEGCE